MAESLTEILVVSGPTPFVTAQPFVRHITALFPQNLLGFFLQNPPNGD